MPLGPFTQWTSRNQSLIMFHLKRMKISCARLSFHLWALLWVCICFCVLFGLQTPSGKGSCLLVHHWRTRKVLAKCLCSCSCWMDTANEWSRSAEGCGVCRWDTAPVQWWWLFSLNVGHGEKASWSWRKEGRVMMHGGHALFPEERHPHTRSFPEGTRRL